MNSPAIVVDNFSPSANEVLNRVQRMSFRPIEHGGATFNGIGLAKCPEAKVALEQAVGSPVDISMQFFRKGVENDQQPTYIHSDAVCDELACVWYLTPDWNCRGGTAFWRHRQTGWKGTPPEGIDQPTADMLNAQTFDESKWDLRHVVPMRFNRAAIYPTSLFHSRYPRDADGYTSQDGRLVWCAFFNRR